jgi:hypothetical protein
MSRSSSGSIVGHFGAVTQTTPIGVQSPGFALPDVDDVAAGHHQPTVGVECHSTDAVTLRYDRLDPVRRRGEVIHATTEDIGEIHATVGGRDGRFGESVSARDAFHAPMISQTLDAADEL